MNREEKLKLINDSVKIYHDFPKRGVAFRDIFPIFQNIVALQAMKDLLVEHVSSLEVDLIVALDSRGFLLGSIICAEIGKPFVPIRKKGKLPGKVIQESYTLEYGEATLELQTESITKGSRVLIVDDVLVTGGTMGAAIKLLKSVEAVIVECLVIIDISEPQVKEKLNIPMYSLL